jgi:hypothetical protein
MSATVKTMTRYLKAREEVSESLVAYASLAEIFQKSAEEIRKLVLSILNTDSQALEKKFDESVSIFESYFVVLSNILIMRKSEPDWSLEYIEYQIYETIIREFKSVDGLDQDILDKIIDLTEKMRNYEIIMIRRTSTNPDAFTILLQKINTAKLKEVVLSAYLALYCILTCVSSLSDDNSKLAKLIRIGQQYVDKLISFSEFVEIFYESTTGKIYVEGGIADILPFGFRIDLKKMKVNTKYRILYDAMKLEAEKDENNNLKINELID